MSMSGFLDECREENMKLILHEKTIMLMLMLAQRFNDKIINGDPCD